MLCFYHSYLESRSVNSLEKLRELLLCDRIKNTLNENVLKHVIAVESAKEVGWVESRELTEIIDVYCSNYTGWNARCEWTKCSTASNYTSV